jgi:hypothetical protein
MVIDGAERRVVGDFLHAVIAVGRYASTAKVVGENVVGKRSGG